MVLFLFSSRFHKVKITRKIFTSVCLKCGNILCNYVLIHRFLEGLSTLNVLQNIRDHPDIMKEAFWYTESTLTAQELAALFVFPDDGWSPMGSNRRADEARTHSYWLDFLQDQEGRTSFITEDYIILLHTYMVIRMVNHCWRNSTTNIRPPFR